MPQPVLGLDIGSESIKGVLALRKGRSDVRVLAAETITLTEGVDLEAAVKKMAAALRPAAPSGMQCVVCIPPSDVMYRQVQLPFRDESKIKKALPFELEPLLPLPVGEVVISYVHLPESGLLVAAIGKEKIRGIIGMVEKYLGKVLLIDIAAAALALPLLQSRNSAGTGILLDIGAASTFAVFYEQNAIVQIRSFVFGGNTITSALAQDLSCENIEAERIKINSIFGEKSWEKHSTQAKTFCRQFCISLKSTVEFMLLNKTLHSAPGRITVTGGGSLFQPLRDELTKIFIAEIVDYQHPGALEIDRKIRMTYQPPIMNTALAAAKRAFGAAKSFNFRQGEFEYRHGFGSLLEQTKRWVIAGGVLLMLAGAHQLIDYRLQSARAADYKAQINAIFKKHHPTAQTIVDPVAQLRSKLEEDKKTYGLAEGGSGTTVLALLKDISGLIAPDMDIVINHLYYEKAVMIIKGDAGRMDDVTAVKNELEKSKHFKNVSIGSTSLAREGSRVNFDLRMEVQ